MLKHVMAEDINVKRGPSYEVATVLKRKIKSQYCQGGAFKSRQI